MSVDIDAINPRPVYFYVGGNVPEPEPSPSILEPEDGPWLNQVFAKLKSILNEDFVVSVIRID